MLNKAIIIVIIVKRYTRPRNKPNNDHEHITQGIRLVIRGINPLIKYTVIVF